MAMDAGTTAAEEVAKAPSLPSYPEMILAAIAALNEENGSDKSAISKYIETAHGELPQSHSSLLTAHLARMKESGELLLVKNNYMRPGPGAPPKRGRGRPPKPKPALAPGAALPSPKPRGRPPKPKDAISVAAVKASPSAAAAPRSLRPVLLPARLPPPRSRASKGAEAGRQRQSRHW